jgi:hypothetical protein
VDVGALVAFALRRDPLLIPAAILCHGVPDRNLQLAGLANERIQPLVQRG